MGDHIVSATPSHGTATDKTDARLAAIDREIAQLRARREKLRVRLQRLREEERHLFKQESNLQQKQRRLHVTRLIGQAGAVRLASLPINPQHDLHAVRDTPGTVTRVGRTLATVDFGNGQVWSLPLGWVSIPGQ
jgi:hypothetical protein